MKAIHRGMSLLAITGFVAALAACADVYQRPSAERAAELPPDKGLILFKAAGVGDRPARRIQYSYNEQRVEYALYKGGGAQAEFVYMERPYNMTVVFNYAYTIADTVESWNHSKGQPTQWDEASFITAKLGNLFYRPYRLTARNQQCFGVNGEWDRDTTDWEQRHTRVMFGYYCAPAGQELTQDRILSLIDGLGLTGVTERSGDYADTLYNFHHDVVTSFAGREGSNKAIEVARNGAGDSAGIAGYPFRFAEHFRPFYGRGNN